MSPSTTIDLGRQISAQLTTKVLGHPLYYLDKVTSTNSLALEAAQRDAAHGTVFAADYQTHGRGRQGRSWDADEGLNLTFSVILDLPIPNHRIGMLPLAACLGVASAISDAVAPHKPQLKWPNDILLGGQKICGILLQTVGPSTNAIVLGIGINVNQTKFPVELELHATSLLLISGQPIDRASLMASVLLNLEEKLDLLILHPSVLHKHYTRNLMGIGERCRVVGINEEIVGTMIGIDDSGALTLATSTGNRTIYAGDVSLHMADH